MIKRISDLVFSFCFFVCSFPLFMLVPILIKITSEGKVTYKQERVGKDGKTFIMYKFRSMVNNAEKKTGPIWAQDNDKRITKIGKFLRESNIDEILQLYNIVKGDMSLVGPRPERPFFVNKFEKSVNGYKNRTKVRPGITGWAQANGYYGNTSLEKRVEHDLYYIENQSLALDVKIIVMTLKLLIGVSPK